MGAIGVTRRNNDGWRSAVGSGDSINNDPAEISPLIV